MSARASAALVLGLAGCAATYGRFEPGVAAPTKDSVAIAVVGGAGARGRAERETAKAVADVLAAARTGDRDSVVLLLGDYAPHRYARRRGRRAKQVPAGPVVATALAASPRVGTRFALRGVAERHHPSRQIEPSPHALVRIGADGRGDTLSRCKDRTCAVTAGDAAGLVDLVLLDLEPWRIPSAGDSVALARMTSLLDAIAAMPADTPRILVLSLPLEGAFETGLGAQFGTAATFHLLPPVLQQHLAAGMFVGVIAGGERALHLAPDLTPAIQRSDRVWLRAPVWQVVSGNANDPAKGRISRRSIWRGGIVHQPAVSSFAPGFAVVRVDGSANVTIDLVAQHRGKWTTARTSLPLRPAANPVPGPTRQLSPCPFCTDVPAGERP